jgi:hypothetical protein
MDNPTRQLVVDVIDDNPGALTIIECLMSYATWYQLLHHLKDQGLVGSTLWRVVKEDYSLNLERFVEDQLCQMAPERARTLRALGQHPSPRHN